MISAIYHDGVAAATMPQAYGCTFARTLRAPRQINGCYYRVPFLRTRVALLVPLAPTYMKQLNPTHKPLAVILKVTFVPCICGPFIVKVLADSTDTTAAVAV